MTRLYGTCPYKEMDCAVRDSSCNDIPCRPIMAQMGFNVDVLTEAYNTGQITEEDIKNLIEKQS